MKTACILFILLYFVNGRNTLNKIVENEIIDDIEVEGERKDDTKSENDDWTHLTSARKRNDDTKDENDAWSILASEERNSDTNDGNYAWAHLTSTGDRYNDTNAHLASVEERNSDTNDENYAWAHLTSTLERNDDTKDENDAWSHLTLGERNDDASDEGDVWSHLTLAEERNDNGWSHLASASERKDDTKDENDAWAHLTSHHNEQKNSFKVTEKEILKEGKDNACNGACERTFYRLSRIPKTWREARKNCKAGGGRLGRVVKSVPSKLAARLSQLGAPLWVGRRKSDPTRSSSASRSCHVALPGSGHSSPVSCHRRHHYLCEYKHTHNAKSSQPASIITPTNTHTTTLCPSGWEVHAGKCYKAFSSWVTWVKAEHTCQSHGGHLLTIGDPSERLALHRMFFGRFVTSPVWIGLRRTENTEAGFEWVDGSTIEIGTWERGEPDNHLGREGCGAATLPSYALTDAQCLTLMPFICETESGIPTLPPPPTTTPPEELCEHDPSWLRLEGNCYKLYGAEDLESWSDSHSKCIQDGAQLASIHSLEENYWLQEKLLRLDVKAVWIGGRVRTEKEYYWRDNTNFTFTNWAPGEPNNVHDQEDCIALYTRRQGYWNDQNCGIKAGSVCKKPLSAFHRPPPSPPPSPVAPTRCPRGFVSVPGSKCYQYIDNLLDFDSARNVCREKSPTGELASVHSKAQQACLTALVGRGERGAWIGMKRQQDHFLWLDQTSVKYTEWAEDEPSGDKAVVVGGRRYRLAEECVEILTHTRAGEWNDATCSEKRAFVCQSNPVVEESNSGHVPSPSPPPESSKCPSQYTRRGHHCYRQVLSPVPWQEAEDACVRDGGHLATVLSKTEAAEVWVEVMEAGVDEAWIGLSYVEEEDALRWSSGWPLLHASWSAISNTSKASKSKDMCVAIDADNGEWVKLACLDHRPYVCHLVNDIEIESREELQFGLSCPDSRWLDFGGEFCYLIVRDPKPWQDARHTCVLEGGDLTSVTSKGEMTFLTRALHDLTQSVWIGLGNPDTTRWTDGSPLNYTNWNEGEPNGGMEGVSPGEGGLCTEVYVNNGRWNDEECTQVRPFICKHVKKKSRFT